MTNYPTYPIYRIIAKWSEDGTWIDENPKRYEGLCTGRVWNSTSSYKMFKEEKSKEELDSFLNEWWLSYLKLKNEEKIKNPELKTLTIEYFEHESWCLTWFQHYTFDIGQTDEEVLDSFEMFVRRKETQSNEKNEYDPYCLMGANDRWRWCGDKGTPAPCRCIHCKEQGLIRIGH